jgi:NAD-dependent dihydropyrimidine dehydrogenase PreA subunit
MDTSEARGLMKWKWIQPSTRAFIHEAQRTPGFSAIDTLHGYIYLRWAYAYIAIGLGEHWINRVIRSVRRLFLGGISSSSDSDEPGGDSKIADVYHGKVLRTDAARKLVRIEEDIELRDLERIIPYPHARDIVLRNPDHIVVIDCPCRSARSNPCKPLDVCLIVGEPFASFIAEHHPEKTRWVDPEEACQILGREHQRGRVHQAFFKDATLGRFYVICNCCACCCGAMQARRNGTPLLAASGYCAEIDVQSCIGCGDCIELCAFGAMIWNGDTALVDQTNCMGCGVCVSACPACALTIGRDPSKGEPLEMDAMIADLQSSFPA